MIRVLVVDDDFRVANLHAHFVRAVAGFDVVAVAHTAATAVEQASKHRPDIALLDLYLPDGRGIDLVGELGCDVVMLTAAADAATVREAYGRGVVNYLVKPFSPADLADRLQAYARYRRHLDGNRALGQTDIDLAARLLRAGDQVQASVRKGRSAHTANLVVEALRGAVEAVSAAEVAALLGLSRPTAQRYLADLAQDGRASVSLRYGSTGRPEHRYQWRTRVTASSPDRP